jgi:L-ascorbate metabolism protein UlaG (beta-lactamase superfamily)
MGEEAKATVASALLGRVRHLGISGFEIITNDGLAILLNPALSANPDRPLQASELTKADFVLVSHGSRFVLGDSFEIVGRTGAILICGPEVRAHAIRCGVDPARIVVQVPGGMREIRGLRIKALPSQHGSFIDSNGTYLSGQSLGFLVGTPSGSFYHTGSTGLFADLQLYGKIYKPDVVFIPIGMTAGGSGLIQMDPDEAALATTWLRPKVVVPMVYTRAKETNQFVDAVRAAAPAVSVRVLDPGQAELI